MTDADLPLYEAIDQDDAEALIRWLQVPGPRQRANLLSAWTHLMATDKEGLAEAFCEAFPPLFLDRPSSDFEGMARSQVYESMLREAAYRGRETWTERLVAVLEQPEQRLRDNHIGMDPVALARYQAIDRAFDGGHAGLVRRLWHEAPEAVRGPVYQQLQRDRQTERFQTLLAHDPAPPDVLQWGAWARALIWPEETSSESDRRDHANLLQVFFPHVDTTQLLTWLTRDQVEWSPAPLPGLLDPLVAVCLTPPHQALLREKLAQSPDRWPRVRERVRAHDRTQALQARPATAPARARYRA